MGEEHGHKPVMLGEVLGALQPKPGGRFCDGTIGAAGHAAAILAASSPDGFLYGCDRDASAVEIGRKRLAQFAGRFELRHGNFSELSDWVPAGSCDGVILDVGLSSRALDDPERGLSFQAEGPLDMRFDRSQARTAGEVINGASAEELARIFWEFGGERQSRRIARAIVQQRERKPFETTRQLAELIERLVPRRGKKSHPATKIFQAVRIEINAELGSLEKGLVGALKILKPGGRLAVLTFHSLEHKIARNFGRERARDYVAAPGEEDIPELRKPRVPELKSVGKALTPSAEEIADNPRSRSAQLRVWQKL